MAWWTRKPKPRTHVPELDRLIRTWHGSMRYHEFHKGSNNAQIESTEQALDFRFPNVCRAIYEMSNGFGICGGNMIFDSLIDVPGGLSVVSLNKMFRESRPDFPVEPVFFGTDGSDTQYALWISNRNGRLPDCPVIATFEMQEPFAIAGTSLVNLLTCRTAFYLMLEPDTLTALDVLGLPRELRTGDPDEETFERILRWADPKLRDPRPDPFNRPVSVDQMRSIYGSA